MHPALQRAILHKPGGNDTFTKLLLHFNGRDGDVATSDSSASAHTVTFVNGAVLDDAQFKFGGTSLICGDGVDDYVYVEDSADFAFGADDFTIDFWIRRSETGTAQHNVFGQGNSGLTGGYHFGKIEPTTSVFRFAMNDEAFNADGAAIADTNWHHVACVRRGPNLAVAIDGTWGSIVSVGTTAYTDTATRFAIGQAGEFTAGSSHAGWIDEFRISKGVARWNPGTNFIPPAREYF